MVQPRKRVAYGLSDALLDVSRSPVVALRVPTAGDIGYDLGQLWIYKTGSAAYILVSVVANQATWSLLETGGGAGVFSSLTVTPGPISLTGATVINNTGAANTAIGTGTNSGVLALGNTANGGTSLEGINITMDSAAAGTIFVGTQLLAANVSILSGVNTGAQVVSILNGNSAGNATFNLMNGVPTAGAQIVNIVGANNTRAAQLNIATGNAGHSVNIGNANAAANITLTAGSAAGVVIDSTGLLAIKQATTAIASPATSVVINKNFFVVQCTGFTTAAAGVQVFTITNALVSAASGLSVTADNGGANDAQMYVTRVKKGVSTFDVTVTNIGTQALNGDIDLTCIVMLP